MERALEGLLNRADRFREQAMHNDTRGSVEVSESQGDILSKRIGWSS